MFNRLIHSGLMLLFQFSIGPLFAQDNHFKFQRIDTNNGLSDGIIHCTLKDSKGYVWFGTDNGLNRYDGYDFKIYQNDPKDSTSIGGNRIVSLTENEEGDLLIGTLDGGLSIYHRSTDQFSVYNHREDDPASLSDNLVPKVLIGKGARVWVATGKGLDFFDPEEQAFVRISTLEGTGIAGLVSARNGGVWAISSDYHIHLIGRDGKVKRSKRFLEGVEYEAIYAVHQDHLKRIWIGTQERGIVIFNPQDDTLQWLNAGNSGLKKNFIRAIYQDGNHRIWIGCDGAGVNIYDPSNNQWQYAQHQIYDDQSISSNAVYSFYGDTEGNIWVGTFKKGVNVYSPIRTKFRIKQSDPGNTNSLSNNSVLGIDVDQEGNVWIGTDGGGLNSYDPETGDFRHFRHRPGRNSISSDIIKSVFIDHEGIVWSGTYLSGLNRYDPGTGVWKNYNTIIGDATSLPFNSVWSIFEDSKKQLWFGFLGDGIARFDREQETFHHIRRNPDDPNGFSESAIFMIIEDDKGRFWLGSEHQGLNVMDPGTGLMTRYIHDSEDANSLINNQIRSMLQDREGTVWIGTVGGLCSYDEPSDGFIPTAINDRLRFPTINGILEDDRGMLWLSGIQGLYRFDPRTSEFQLYDRFDGVQGEFNYTSQTESTEGTFYFGGLNGFNSFDPLNIPENQYEPPVVLSALHVLGKAVNMNDTLNDRIVYAEPLNDIAGFSLLHEENIFTISFSALDYVAPERIRYQYMLEGFDQDWIHVNADKREATYMNLPPGPYVFRLRATNSDARWSRNEKTLSITILPPWWQTWWFRTFVAVLLIGLVYWFFDRRTRRQRKMRELLETEVDDATSRLQKQKEELELQRDGLSNAIAETNFVIGQALDSGDFSARLPTDGKSGIWLELSHVINRLFDSVVGPFREINVMVARLSDGDLSMQMSEDTHGDILEISQNFNHALANISELLKSITSKVQDIEMSTLEMKGSSDIMLQSTREISSSIAEMSNGATTQAEGIDQSSIMAEKIKDISFLVGTQASSIYEMARKGVEQSDQGTEVIAGVEKSVKEILTYSDMSNASMGTLRTKANEINRILGIINEIASQTNLLALNAAIEAAQAGDAGRGFAVVANEIRKLASDSKQSAKEIEALVEEVQIATKETSALFLKMAKSVAGGDDATGKAASAFKEMASSFSETLSISEQIVEATEKQSEAVGHVVDSTESVAVIAEETAAGAGEIAASSTELSQGMTEYTVKTKEVQSIISELRAQVDQFKLRRESQEQLENSEIDVSIKS